MDTQTNTTEIVIPPVEAVVTPVETTVESNSTVVETTVEIKDDAAKAAAKVRTKKIHEWKVAVCRGDFFVAKSLYKQLELTAPKVLKITLATADVVRVVEKTPDVTPRRELKPGKKRGRKAREYTFPEGEFTVAGLVDLWQVSQPQANNVVTAGLNDGTITVLRSENVGRGKPRRILSKVVVGATAELQEKQLEVVT